jgi:glutaredoxin
MQIVVYSKLGCPFCSLLKMELMKRSLTYTEVDLTDDALRQEFYGKTETNTVPQVFLMEDDASLTDPVGRRLGGYSDVSKDWSVLGT